jgi:ATP-binding cassette subfamily C protein LapB
MSNSYTGDKKDALLEALVLYTKLYHKPYTAEALTVGLPVEKGGEVELFSLNSAKGLFARAAERAGLKSKVVHLSIDDISSLLLPVILTLKGKKACILERFSEDGREAKIIMPELGETEHWVSVDELKNEYLGYAFLIKKVYRHEDKEKKNLQIADQHWFWGTVKLSSRIYKDVLVASLLLNLFVLASPLFTMNVYDRVVPHNAIETLWVFAIGIVVAYSLDTFLKFTRTRFLEIAAKKSDVIMSSYIFEQVLNLKMEAKPKSVGSFANNLRDFDSIRSFFTNTSMAAIIDLPFAVIFLAVIFYIGGILVLVPMVVIGIILLYTLSLKGPLERSQEETHEASAQKNAILIETLLNMETIKTLGASGYSQWKWEEATGEIAKKGMASKMMSSSIPTINGFFVHMNTVALIVMGVYMINANELTQGGLIATVMLSSRTISPFSQVAGLISNFTNVKSSYKTLNDIMQMPVERERGHQFIQNENIEGNIVFENVSFTYPDEERPALDDVSFTINKGEHVGILGKIGSGKSTIQKLIMGLYAPTEGSITIDGIDINQLDPAVLRKQISYVAQDAILFKGTVKENILYKAPYATDAQVIEAAKLSGTDTFVNQHPKGYEMNVGERGESLSGGQRQAVSVARAFIIETPIVLLDEPSNAMDQSLEKNLQRNLTTKLEGKTTIMIAHKSAMLGLVDRLIIIENGRIVADGPKEEVLNKLRG